MAMNTDGHDRFREQSALYAAGALDAAERLEFESHLSGCAECAAEIRALAPVTDALLLAVPQIDPPPALRARVLDGAPGTAAPAVFPARARTYSAVPAWIGAAALVAIAVSLGAYAGFLRARVNGLESELRVALVRIDASERDAAAARQLAASAQTPIGVLTSPDVKQISLMGQTAAPSAMARAFWSRSRGLVFTASMLPELPPGRTYQLWVVTAQTPISAGLLMPDQNGELTATFNTPSDIPEPVAMAVTSEPDGGVPAPTGDRYLVGAAR